MTRRHDLEHHRNSLAEIRDIMNSMNTLAYLETRKLSRFLDAQHAVVAEHRGSGSGFTRLVSRHPARGASNAHRSSW